MKIQGVDASVLNQIQERTQKAKVQEAEKTRIDTENERRRRQEFSYHQSLESSVRQLNQMVETFNIQLRFKIDRESGEIVVLVIDKAKDKIIRRIPPDKIINLAAQMQHMVGLLVDELI
ncbi:flagellar protein FlaG [Calderihabitans maritimus]|uniref:Uncharacterized flagellar protein FlaG n=1 Tax=Calderihabitans maritimus TaxID=1246530 RepID=A0A1Z5HTP4_9FIRM|nr:flagellar protein FlaG [Calderihabitans maritimus]GAW92909.1 uncharacterized flagellar protein FlaG [Calderihabitans maritimus]